MKIINTHKFKYRKSLFFFIKIFLLIFLGSLSYPKITNLGLLALVPIIFIFIHTLFIKDYFSFLLLVFVSNHFPYGNQIGGVYILSAGIALTYYYFFFTNTHKKNLLISSITRLQKSMLIVFFFIQILSIIIGSSNFSIEPQIIASCSFFFLLLLFYFFTKIIITDLDFKKLFVTFFFVSVHMLLVSLNQIFKFIQPNPFFVLYSKDSTFELDILRSSGTFLNFEAYAEYSLSIIAILLCLIISGSINKFGLLLKRLIVTTIIISIIAIILSGTRSSLYSLPLLFIIIIFAYRKKIKILNMFIFIFLCLMFFLFNPLSFFNLDSFTKRNEGTKFEFNKILSGEGTNRSSVYEHGFEKIQKGNLLIGQGYFTTRDEYHFVHFDNTGIEYPDYHNLYLSSIVIWGICGTIIFFSILLYPIYKGLSIYSKLKKKFLFKSDLLCGFNIMFIFLMVNEYKIQFIRETNYFMLIFIFLAIYYNVIKKNLT